VITSSSLRKRCHYESVHLSTGIITSHLPSQVSWWYRGRLACSDGTASTVLGVQASMAACVSCVLLTPGDVGCMLEEFDVREC